MPHIVTPLNTNLWLQMLLEANIYITITWAILYPVYMIYNDCTLQLALLLAYAVVLLTEWARLYFSYTLNLCYSRPQLMMLLVPTLVACVPLVMALHYLRLETCYSLGWLSFIWNLWYGCILLQILVLLSSFRSRHHRLGWSASIAAYRHLGVTNWS